MFIQLMIAVFQLATTASMRLSDGTEVKFSIPWLVWFLLLIGWAVYKHMDQRRPV